jgi:hypothetical protein
MPLSNYNMGQYQQRGGEPYPDYLETMSGRGPNRSYTQSQTQSSSSTSTPYSPVGGPAGIGTLSFDPNANQGYSGGTGYGSSGSVAMQQHQRYISNYRDFEEALIQSRQDTSLIDAVPGDVEQQTEIAKGIAERNKRRYGYNQTAVEARESQRESERGASLGLAGGLTNARLAQRESNMRMLGDLINIGQGVNRSALQQLGVADENATARKNAYTQAKASHKSQTLGMLGSLGAMAIMFAL